MDLRQLEHIYFVGIGGIGMSALARWFSLNGAAVAGYDRVSSELTVNLEEEGMAIHYSDDPALIPEEFKNPATLVVYTPAIPEDHHELIWFRSQGNTIRKRSEVLGDITDNFFTIAVSGTHGKTTTSSIVAHLLKESGKNVSAFIGGISLNYNSNLLLAEPGPDQVVVVEADEYDRSFLTLSPDIAVINNIEADHLDIYENEAEFTKSFLEFSEKIEDNGVLITKSDVKIDKPAHVKAKTTFGIGSGDYSASDLRVEDGMYCYTLTCPGRENLDIKLPVPGKHNVLNSLAAFAVGDKAGIPAEKLAHALASFKGVKRRFEYLVRNDKVVFIDDYAHHPTEVESFLSAVKELYPDKKVTAVFQPHLYSRTRDFMKEFAESLSLADRLYLLDIYPAREQPVQGVNSQALLDKVKLEDKFHVGKEELLKVIEQEKPEVLLTMGAGDIHKLTGPIKNILEQEERKDHV